MAECSDEGSITHCLGLIRAGDRSAAQPLWERYFGRLVRLARQKLAAGRRRGGDADEEDAALSAFDSFCASAAKGRFPRLDDRDDLWHILVTLTRRKALDQVRRQQRQKRGGGRAVSETALAGADEARSVFDEIAGSEPTPEFAAMVADECRHRLGSLRDDSLRRVALLRMEGYSNEEIAAKLGCVTRSVERKLNVIRQAWLAEGR